MKFHATVELGGKTATGIQVPAEIVENLGSRRPSVRVTIGAHTYRSTVMARGDRFMLPISAENRQSAGVAAGDEVEVGIELDTEPREVTVPADLAEAIDRHPGARRFFDGLTYTQQRWYVLWIEGAKKPETRQRRVAEAAKMLQEGRVR